MAFLTTLLALTYVTCLRAAPAGPLSTWELAVEPFDYTPSSGDLTNGDALDPEDLTAIPGFAGMTRPGNSTLADKFMLPDLSSGLQLDDGTCKYVTLSGNGKVGETSLSAKCVDGRGVWWDTNLNLNLCAANLGGALMFEEDGGFDERCRPCMVTDGEDVDGLQLRCRCVGGENGEGYALLPLGSQGMSCSTSLSNVFGRWLTMEKSTTRLLSSLSMGGLPAVTGRECKFLVSTILEVDENVLSPGFEEGIRFFWTLGVESNKVHGWTLLRGRFNNTKEGRDL